MAKLKREYVVPLRGKSRTAPKWRRSKKAVSVLRDFIKKHMKTDEVIICSQLNEYIWLNGGKNPPGKVSVIALKTQIGDKEKTLVNLLEHGIDEQLTIYNNLQSKTPNVETKEKEDTSEIKDVESKEVESKETKSKTQKKDDSKGVSKK